MKKIFCFFGAILMYIPTFGDTNDVNELKANSTIFRVGEDLFDAKASGNNLIVEPHIQKNSNERKYVLINLSEDIDDSTISFVKIINVTKDKVDVNKSFFVSVSCKEMKSIIKLKNMFLPSAFKNTEEREDILKLFKKNVCLADFKNDIYQGDINGQTVNVFFSNEAKKEVSNNFNYDGLIDFLMEMDIESLGVTDLSFDIIKSLLNNIKNRGLMMGISILLGEKRETLFQVFKIDKIEIDLSIFKIPKGIKRKGIEELL